MDVYFFSPFRIASTGFGALRRVTLPGKAREGWSCTAALAPPRGRGPHLFCLDTRINSQGRVTCFSVRQCVVLLVESWLCGGVKLRRAEPDVAEPGFEGGAVLDHRSTLRPNFLPF